MKSLFQQKNHKGFTLIETLVSILIFSAALLSLMAIAGKGIGETEVAKEETVAHYLAQEGLEVVRNVRDTNYLNSAAWDANFGTMCAYPNTCNVSYNGGTSTPTLETCTSNCQVAENANGQFVDAPGSGYSPYTRKIYVTGTIAPGQTATGEYKVTSVVTWTSKSIPRTVVLETLLTQWR